MGYGIKIYGRGILTRMGKSEYICSVTSVATLKRKHHLGDVSVHERIILN
jgi:hypothetical protein